MSETHTMPIKELFVPKQMISKTMALYKELTGDSSIDAAAHTITHLLPPFTADAIIQDNGCGTGEVTKAIMESHPPEVSHSRKLAVEANFTPTQSLTFPDHYFTHLFSNFFTSHLNDNHDPAAKQVYRTLKSGGIAIVSRWAAMAHGEPIKRAHLGTRGPVIPFPIAMPTQWYGQDALRNFYIIGGFKGEDINITTCNVSIEAKDLRRLMSATWSFWGAS
ncbi:hypothetical protein BTUL_0284g00050 [Botrytis tulipae]|uniref:Methyltransferase type 11 domain-containing protein n=1 Tax=Botrytis tulipae TaxID=87230 RepID=A0A4Z1E7M9_9HELO|nr:hypothetical protein BTUL_0284g00050 [Botrytis tulipae]